jgi:hypothetical protein
MTDFHSVISTPVTNLSVNFTIKMEMKKPTTHKESNLIGKVISLSIHPRARLTSHSMKINISNEAFQRSSTMPDKYPYSIRTYTVTAVIRKRRKNLISCFR